MKQIDAKGQMSKGAGKGGGSQTKEALGRNFREVLSRVVELLTPHKSPRLKAVCEERAEQRQWRVNWEYSPRFHLL